MLLIPLQNKNPIWAIPEAEPPLDQLLHALMYFPMPIIRLPKTRHNQIRRLAEKLQRPCNTAMPALWTIAFIQNDLRTGIHLHEIVCEGHAREVGSSSVAVEELVEEFLALGFVGFELGFVADLQQVCVRRDVGHVHAGAKTEVVFERGLQ